MSHVTREQKHRFGITEWLSIAQLLALVVSGIWTALLFLKFDAKDKQLTREKTELELRRLKAAPLSADQDISIWLYRESKQKADDLGIDYHYSITNTSGQKIKVAQVVVHAALLPKLSLRENVQEIPPLLLTKESPWKRVLSKAYLADDEETDGGVVKSAEGLEMVPSRGGGLTGDMEPGEVHWGSLSLLTKPRGYDYVGFTLEAFVRFEDNTTRWVSSDQYARLLPSDYSGSPKSNAKAERKSVEK